MSQMDPAAVPSSRLIVDIQNPGRVTVAVLNTGDEAMGDYWVAYETDPDTAELIGRGLIAKAAEARQQEASLGLERRQVDPPPLPDISKREA